MFFPLVPPCPLPQGRASPLWLSPLQIVFPTFVIEAYPNCTDGHGKIVWNAATAQLLTAMIDEVFAKW